MIRVLLVTPVYEADGTLAHTNISVEIKLASGEAGNANFTLSPSEIEFSALSDDIKQKLLKGLAAKE